MIRPKAKNQQIQMFSRGTKTSKKKQMLPLKSLVFLAGNEISSVCRTQELQMSRHKTEHSIRKRFKFEGQVFPRLANTALG